MRSIIVAVAFSLVAAGAAWGQQVRIQAPAPERELEFEVIPPGLHYETTRPSDADFYPQGPRVRHDPALIAPFAARTETPAGTGRVGLAGWTSPNTPVGAQQTGHREVTGWLALGFAIEWGGPPPPPKRPRP